MSGRIRIGGGALVAAATMGWAGAAAAAIDCASLGPMALPDGRILSAESVAPGSFDAPGPTPPVDNVPAFCRVVGRIGDNINFEVWLPERWNGKFLGVGNGGYAGAISYYAGPRVGPSMALINGLQRGYAVASTDTGHAMNMANPFDASWGRGRPDLIEDYAHRAIHKMTVAAKAIVSAHYGRPASRAYFDGCSGGGRQGLVEAERYPADYDGVVAGAPANPFTPLMAGLSTVGRNVLGSPDSVLPAAKLALIHKAVLAKCDKLDGVEDGALEDPRQCRFDPGELQCSAGNGGDCLTVAQVRSARALYADATLPNGRQIFPGFEVSSEGDPLMSLTIGGPRPFPISDGFYTHWVHNDPSWDFRRFRLESDGIAGISRFGALLDAGPDLRRFKARGGRLILWHGWMDPTIAPRNSIDYFTALDRRTGAKGFATLFMVPGMGHCNVGSATRDFDSLSALEQWVEQGRQPTTLIASASRADGSVRFRRTLCPYPARAAYDGRGDPNSAESFQCRKPN